MHKVSLRCLLRVRIHAVLAVGMVLLFTGSAFADQFYFTQTRTTAGSEGLTGLFLWSDKTGEQSQVGGYGLDEHGWTALTIAKLIDHRELMELLERAE